MRFPTRFPTRFHDPRFRRAAVLGVALGAAALAAGLSTTAQEPDDGEPVVEREVERVIVRAPHAAGEAGEGAPRKVRVMVKKGDGEPEVREFTVPAGVPFDVGEHFRERVGGPHLATPMVWFGDGPRGYLGVELTALTPELRRHFGAGEEAGLLVGRVEPESPADRAGVRVGDVVTRVDGTPVGSTFDVVRAIGDKEEGELVAVELVRDGRVETVSAAVARREVPRFDVGPIVRRFAFEGGEGEEAFEVDMEALGEKMERLDAYFKSPEWEAQVERLEGLGSELEKRLEGLEVDLERLERELGDVEVRVEVVDETEERDEP